MMLNDCRWIYDSGCSKIPSKGKARACQREASSPSIPKGRGRSPRLVWIYTKGDLEPGLPQTPNASSKDSTWSAEVYMRHESDSSETQGLPHREGRIKWESECNHSGFAHGFGMYSYMDSYVNSERIHGLKMDSQRIYPMRCTCIHTWFHEVFMMAV